MAIVGLPPAVNFLHLPVLFGSYLLSRVRPHSTRLRVLEVMMAVFTVLTFASFVGSDDSSILRTALLWPVLIEAFIVIATIWHLAESGLQSEAPKRLALALVLIQVPLAIGQALMFGIGDEVQGTLVNQGAGHHVLGAMGLVAALAGFAAIVVGRAPIRSVYGFAVLGGFVLAVLSDMKQGLVVFFVVAVGLVLARRGRHDRSPLRGPSQAVVRLVSILSIVALAFTAVAWNQGFATVASESWRFDAVVEAKSAALVMSSELMQEQPHSFLVGLGPGTTFTRVAWLSSPLGRDSYLESFGLSTSETSTRMASEWLSNPAWRSSSVSSPFSSWTGILGDLGLFGLAAYAGLWWAVWYGYRDSSEKVEVRAVLVFLVLLGGLFNWLEEPVLGIVAALMVGGSAAPAKELVKEHVSQISTLRPSISR